MYQSLINILQKKYKIEEIVEHERNTNLEFDLVNHPLPIAKDQIQRMSDIQFLQFHGYNYFESVP